MFACVYGHSQPSEVASQTASLLELADQFSPLVECVSDDTVVFSIAGLKRLFGDPHQIASAISRYGSRMKLNASLVIAANSATAILAARNLRGVTIISAGQETAALSSIPIGALQAEPELISVLVRWGVQTLGQLAALPEIGVRERLGEAGLRLWRLARGCEVRILDIAPSVTEYSLEQALDHPIETLEPLFFVISGQLHDLTQRLQQNGMAARSITIKLKLDRTGEFVRKIDLPFAMRDPKVLLKQVQLSLEADAPADAIVAVRITLDADDPRIVQGGLFLAASPEPEKLETLLARLRALVGNNRVGTPEILNTYRPDAYRLRPCAFEPSVAEISNSTQPLIRLALRLFRPPITAQVTIRGGTPRKVSSLRVGGSVLQSAGPWRTSGESWTDTKWDRDEWDVELDNGGIYRIYFDRSRWFIAGSYD